MTPLSPACQKGKHGKCTGSFEARQGKDRLAVICDCTCHKRRVVVAV